jgi:hypothetical protein
MVRNLGTIYRPIYFWDGNRFRPTADIVRYMFHEEHFLRALRLAPRALTACTDRLTIHFSAWDGRTRFELTLWKR